MAEGTSVGSLYYDLNIDDKNLKSQLDSADKKVSNFGQNLHDGLNKAAAGFAVVGAGLTLIAKNATDFTVDLVKSSKSLATQIGTSTEEASRLVAAFGRMGISAENASQMFGIFSKNIAKATEASKDTGLAMQKAQIQIDKTKMSISQTNAEIQKNGDKTGELALKLRDLNNTLATQQAALSATGSAFDKLGISTVDSAGKQKTFNTILFEVADKFQGMPNGIDKTTLALELFGRSGKDMIKVLNLGSEGIQELEKQADKLGITLTAQNISAVSDYIKSQKDLKQSTDAVKLAIGTTTAPVLTEFNKALNDVILGFISSDGPMKTFTVNVLAFGGPIFGATAALLSFGASIAQIGSVIGFAVLGTVALAIGAFIALGVAIFEMIQHAEQLGTIFVIVTDQIQMKLHALWDWIASNWPLLLAIITGPFGLAVYEIIKHFTGIKNAVLGFFSGAGKWLWNAGASVVQGLLDGAGSLLSKVGQFFLDKLPGWIRTPFKKALGIASPSKVFAEMGRNVTEGFVQGINDTSNLALNAMSQLGNAVISPQVNFGSAVGGAGGGGSNIRHGDTIVNVDTINNAQDEAYVLRHLDRNQSLESMGISPAV